MPKSIQQYPDTELCSSRYWTASSRLPLRGLPSYFAFSLIPAHVEAVPTLLPRDDCSARIAKNSPRLNTNPRRCSMVNGVFRFRAIRNCAVKRYHQFHMADATEQKASGCKPTLALAVRCATSSRIRLSRARSSRYSAWRKSMRSYRRSPTCAPGPRCAGNLRASSMGALMMTRRPGKVWLR